MVRLCFLTSSKSVHWNSQTVVCVVFFSGNAHFVMHAFHPTTTTTTTEQNSTFCTNTHIPNNIIRDYLKGEEEEGGTKTTK